MVLSNYLQSYIIEFLVEYLIIYKKTNRINKKSILNNNNEIIKYSSVSKHWLQSIQSTLKTSFDCIDFQDDQIIINWWYKHIEKSSSNSIFYKLKPAVDNKKNEDIKQEKEIIHTVITEFNEIEFFEIWGTEQPNPKPIYNINIIFDEDNQDLPFIAYSNMEISHSENATTKQILNTNKLVIGGVLELIEKFVLYEVIRDCNPRQLIIEPQSNMNMGSVYQHHNFSNQIFKHLQPTLELIKIDMNDYLDPFQLANIHKLSKLHTLSVFLNCHSLIKQCFFYYQKNCHKQIAHVEFENYDYELIGNLLSRSDLPCKCIEDYGYTYNINGIISDLKAMSLGISNSQSLKNLTLKNRCFGECYFTNDIENLLNGIGIDDNEFYTITNSLESLISTSKSIEFLKFQNFDFLNQKVLNGLLSNKSIKTIYFKSSLPTINQLKYLLFNVLSGIDCNKTINHLIVRYPIISELNKGFQYHSQFNSIIIQFLNDKSSLSSNLYSIEFPIDINQIDDFLNVLNKSNPTNIVQFNLLVLHSQKFGLKNLTTNVNDKLKLKLSNFTNINNKIIKIINKFIN